MNAVALVVAAGAGRRMGGETPKQYLAVGGEPLLLHALRPFLAHPWIGRVLLVLPPAEATRPPGWLEELPVERVPGGAERPDSVWNGLERVPAGTDRVLIHDGVRPLVPPELIERVLQACDAAGAVPALPVTDTVKEVDGDGWVRGTLSRDALRAAQTPQGFPFPALLEAYRRSRQAGERPTDDAAVFEGHGGRVRVVRGARWNLKVTLPDDLPVVEHLLAREGHAPLERPPGPGGR